MGEDNGDDVDIQGRVSTFFIIIGIGLLALFYISGQLSQLNLWYFCIGTVILSTGWLLFVRRHKTPVQSQRFMGIRKISARMKASREARAKAKAEKQAQKEARKKKK